MAYSKKRNQPRGGTAGASRPIGEEEDVKRKAMRWAIAVLCAAVVCGSLWWWLGGRETPRPAVDPAKPITKPVRPTSAPARPAVTNAAEVVEEKPEVPYWEVDASQTNGFTRAMQKKWEHRHRPKYAFDAPKRKPRAKYRIFGHRSENEIAALLMAKPGASMIGRPNYHGLTEDFMKSCEEPILVTKDDDEYTAALKREMIQTKIELRQRLAEGEKLEQIIEDTRAEYRKLSEYKRSLTKEVMGMIRKDDVSAADVDAFVDAANKMLEEKGIAPIKISNITRQWIINNKGDL